MKKIRLALIGKNISHSLSKLLYKKYYENYSYDLLDFDSSLKLPTLEELSEKYDGVNITSPYKEFYFGDAYPVNSIRLFRGRSNNFKGILSDEFAFEYLWKKNFHKYWRNDRVIVLGDGVMGKMVIRILEKLEVGITCLSRSKKNLNSHFESNDYNKAVAHLIINTCSREYIFKHNLNSDCTFWDFNYHFPEHEKLKLQCSYFDGLELLEKQAYYAVQFWNF